VEVEKNLNARNTTNSLNAPLILYTPLTKNLAPTIKKTNQIVKITKDSLKKSTSGIIIKVP
jgi:hypothetical protein